MDRSDLIFQFGGFPEPLFSGSEQVYKIWSRQRLELLIRQDIPDTSNLLNTSQIDILSLLMPLRVGSPLSVESLREDLDVAHTTVSRWLNALAQVYYHYAVSPFSKKINRSLKKDRKIYLFDSAQVEQPGPRFENMVANHLKKMVDYYNDTGQADLKLCYLRDKDKNEVDFIILNRDNPIFSVECKMNDLKLDQTFKKFQKNYKFPHFQIVKEKNVRRYFKDDHAWVMSFHIFFSEGP